VITWNVIRAAGIGAYLMLWASVAWGLVSTTSLFGKKMPKATSVALHQAFSTTGLILLATHLGVLLFDRFMPFAPLDLVVPMRATYRPVGVTLGIISMFVFLLGVFATSWGRRLIGTTWWRRMHALSVPGFTLALLHGLAAGTDARRIAMFAMYVATATVVIFLLVVRALTASAARRNRAPFATDTRKSPTARSTVRPSATSLVDRADRRVLERPIGQREGG
jgi:methionine sulfoxide reductase heme-binding subunit